MSTDVINLSNQNMLYLIKRQLMNSNMAWLRNFGREVLSKLNINAWAKLKSGDYLKVDLSNSVGRSIWLRGEYCPLIEKVLYDRLPPGGIFVDVGANVGYFTLLAARIVGKQGSVFSFEPIPYVADLLKQSTLKNGINRVTVEQVALGSKPGISKMQVQLSSGISYLGDITNIRAKDRVRLEIKVPVDTLDRYIERKRIECINLIKIDVEGYELNVLKGAYKVLQNQKPDLIIEVAPINLERFKCNAIELFHFLSNFGYTAYKIETGKKVDINFLPEYLEDILFSCR